MTRLVCDEFLRKVTCGIECASVIKSSIDAAMACTLYATDHVVILGLRSLTNDAERVVFHHCGSADPAKQPLLHPTLEADDGDFLRRLCIRKLGPARARTLRTSSRFRSRR